MLKILKVRATGFRIAEDGFEISLLNRSRVTDEELDSEVLKLAENLYTFRTFAFTGSNASGKSTVLYLLWHCYDFLENGRWPYMVHDMPTGTMKIHLEFFLDGSIYFYDFCLGKPEPKYFARIAYATIRDEKLFVLTYRKNFGRNYAAHFPEAKDLSAAIREKSLDDTSSIVKIVPSVHADSFTTNNLANLSAVEYAADTFFRSLQVFDFSLTSSIITLLDQSIETIKVEESGYVKFKRKGEDEIEMTKADLLSLLSDGTVRGTEMFIRALEALKQGGVFFVDEIENCFHRNLVNNILFLFNDATVNPHGAQLFFSTHYSQILDALSRRDNIFVLHQKTGRIRIDNLYDAYDLRSEPLKSRAFDNNVFDTQINYEQLMKVRDGIIHETNPSHV